MLSYLLWSSMLREVLPTSRWSCDLRGSMALLADTSPRFSRRRNRDPKFGRSTMLTRQLALREQPLSSSFFSIRTRMDEWARWRLGAGSSLIIFARCILTWKWCAPPRLKGLLGSRGRLWRELLRTRLQRLNACGIRRQLTSWLLTAAAANSPGIDGIGPQDVLPWSRFCRLPLCPKSPARGFEELLRSRTSPFAGDLS